MDFFTLSAPQRHGTRSKNLAAFNRFYRLNPETKRRIIMKIQLVTVLLFAACLQLSAAGFSQNINLNEKNASLQTVLTKIEKQSGYDIFMQTELLAKSNAVTINVKHGVLEKVLKTIFKQQPLTYAIVGHTIVLKESNANSNGSSMEAAIADVVSGKVVDADTKEPLTGATITVKGTNKSTSAGLDGSFKINVSGVENPVLVISFVGYTQQEITVAGKSDVGEIDLKYAANGMSEVVITGDVAIDRKTPVAVSTVSSQYIQEKLGNQDIPELLAGTPGVMATAQDGGYGDSRISIRGFSSASKDGNVALTVNGIPVNDMENGSIYWSDFSGLTDVTTSVQIQRGLGASKVIIPSFGGTINITTRSTDMEKGGFVSQSLGSEGYNKTTVLISSGLTKNGWAATFQGSRTMGDGFADGLNFLGYNYFFNLSKVLSPNQTLSFNLMGASQTHGQRPKELISDIQGAPQGIRWNSELGVENGKQVNPYNNFFSKPLMSLNHEWTINDKSNLSTVLYATYGTGGGGGYAGGPNSSETLPRISNMYSPIDYDAIQKSNVNNPDGSALFYLYSSHNDHAWYGLRSTYKTKLGKYIDLSTGIDARYYYGTHYEEVSDLLGADYALDQADVNTPNHRALVGDKVGYYNRDFVESGGVFAQAEYSKKDFSLFITLSGSGEGDKRADYFTYLNSDPTQTSGWQRFFTYQAKTGANYNINDHMNVFANIGYMTKPPYFDNVFEKFTNQVNDKTIPEKLFSYELGYGYKTAGFGAKLNLYRTSYMDKSFSNSYTDIATNQLFGVNISGVNELHQGVELELNSRPSRLVDLRGMLSIGDWYYTSNAGPATAYNAQHQAIGTLKEVYLKNLKVGNAAQTTGSLGAEINLLHDLKIGADYFYYGNYHSYFLFTNLTKPGLNPWVIPNYSIWNLNAVFKFKIAGLNSLLIGNVQNLLDTKYISDSFDTYASGDPNQVLVYYGLGRTFTTTLKINF